MKKARWFAGSVMAVALLAGGGSAQAQLRQSTPQEQDDLAQPPTDETPPADEAQDAPAPDDQAAPPRADDDFSDVVAQDEQNRASDPRSERYDRRNDGTGAAPRDRANDQEKDELTTSCALAARDEAERDGGYAEVRQVQQPRETRNGYDVEGDVEVRTGWRAQDGAMRHFTCSVQNGRIADVYFQRDRAAR